MENIFLDIVVVSYRDDVIYSVYLRRPKGTETKLNISRFAFQLLVFVGPHPYHSFCTHPVDTNKESTTGFSK